MYTVMTVCTGNICRSPMAEIILRTEFERRGLADKVNVESIMKTLITFFIGEISII